MKLSDLIKKHFDVDFFFYHIQRGYDMTTLYLSILAKNGIKNIDEDMFPVYEQGNSDLYRDVRLIGYDKIVNGEIVSFINSKQTEN